MKGLKEEVKLLKGLVDRNPDVIRFALENLQLKEKMSRYTSFEGEREKLMEEVAALRDQVLEFLEAEATEGPMMVQESGGTGGRGQQQLNKEQRRAAALEREVEAAHEEMAELKEVQQQLSREQRRAAALEREVEAAREETAELKELQQQLNKEQQRAATLEREVQAAHEEMAVSRAAAVAAEERLREGQVALEEERRTRGSPTKRQVADASVGTLSPVAAAEADCVRGVAESMTSQGGLSPFRGHTSGTSPNLSRLGRGREGGASGVGGPDRRPKTPNHRLSMGKASPSTSAGGDGDVAADVAALRAEVARVEAQLADVREYSAEEHARAEELRGALAAEEGRSSAAEHQVDELQALVAALREQLEAACQRHVEAVEAARLREEESVEPGRRASGALWEDGQSEGSSPQKARVDEELESLRQQCTTLRMQILVTGEELEGAQAHIQEVEVAAAEARQLAAEARQVADESCQLADTRAAQLAAAEGEAEALRGALAEAQTTARQLADGQGAQLAATAETAARQLADDRSAQLAAVEAARQLADEWGAQLAAAEGEVEALRRALADGQSAHLAACQLADERGAQLAAAEGEAEALRQALEEAEGSLCALEGQLSQQMEELSQQMEEQSALKEELSQQKERLSQQTEEQRAAVEEAEARARALEGALAKAEAGRREMEVQLREALATAEGHREAREAAEAHAAELAQRVLQAEVGGGGEERERLHRQLQQLKEELATKAREAESLQAKAQGAAEENVHLRNSLQLQGLERSSLAKQLGDLKSASGGRAPAGTREGRLQMQLQSLEALAAQRPSIASGTAERERSTASSLQFLPGALSPVPRSSPFGRSVSAGRGGATATRSRDSVLTPDGMARLGSVSPALTRGLAAVLEEGPSSSAQRSGQEFLRRRRLSFGGSGQERASGAEAALREELAAAQARLEETAVERDRWLKEAERRQTEVSATRTASAKLREMQAALVQDKKALQAQAAAQAKRQSELEHQLRKLEGQQNLSQRIQHHAKVKEENNRLKVQLAAMEEELRRQRTQRQTGAGKFVVRTAAAASSQAEEQVPKDMDGERQLSTPPRSPHGSMSRADRSPLKRLSPSAFR